MQTIKVRIRLIKQNQNRDVLLDFNHDLGVSSVMELIPNTELLEQVSTDIATIIQQDQVEGEDERSQFTEEDYLSVVVIIPEDEEPIGLIKRMHNLAVSILLRNSVRVKLFGDDTLEAEDEQV